MSRAEFVARANKVHNSAYNYSNVRYVNSTTKVEIVCPKHGSYFTTPAVHLKCGCRECSAELRREKSAKTTEKFIEEAIQIHGDLYDYSKVKYVNKRTNVTIICALHGEFEQLPSNHLSGKGCKYCSRESANTSRKPPNTIRRVVCNDSFIARAKEIHGDRYDYSKVNYVNSRTPVTIVCREHGSFKQLPANHVSGHQCKKCNLKERSEALSMGTDGFIAQSAEVHGGFYDYSKVEYVSRRKRVTVICPIHGDFEVVAGHHLRGVKCGKCQVEVTRASKEEFIRKSRLIHGDRYDYSKVRYVSNKEKVTIVCPLHGEFQQMPKNHSSESISSGCPTCNQASFWEPSRLTEEQRQMPSNTYVMFMEDPGTGESFIKVGISNDVERRKTEIERESSYRITLLSSVALSFVEAWDLEQQLHRDLAGYSVRPRNSFAGMTECLGNSAIVELVEDGTFEFDELPIQLQMMVPSRWLLAA